MATKEFDLIVWGAEGPGLWLAQRTWALLRNPPGGTAATPQPRIAVLSARSQLPTTLGFPELGKRFGLPGRAVAPLQLVSRRGVLEWTDAGLQRRFPAVPLRAERLKWVRPDFSPSATGLQVMRHLCRVHPELLTFAHCINKWFGRCDGLSPEIVLWNALFVTEPVAYSYLDSLPAEWEVPAWNPDATPIESFQLLKDGRFRLQLAGHPEYVAARWLFCGGGYAWARSFGHDEAFLRLWNQDPRHFSQKALYPVRFSFAAGAIPIPVPPLFFWLDTENLPDIDSEVFPIEVERSAASDQITVWVTQRAGAPLEAVLESARQALGRLHRLLPLAMRQLRAVSPTLGLESCYGAEARAAAIAQLGSDSRDIYQMTCHRSDTREPSLWNLMPALFCEMPGPAGGLHAAEALSHTWFGKKRVQRQFELPLQAG